MVVFISPLLLELLVQAAKLYIDKAFRPSRRTQAAQARSSSSTNNPLLLSTHTSKLPQGAHSEMTEDCATRQRLLRSLQDQDKRLVRLLLQPTNSLICLQPSRVLASTALKRQGLHRLPLEARTHLEAATHPFRTSISACESIKEPAARLQVFQRPSSRTGTLMASTTAALQSSRVSRRRMHLEKV
jgi:hypothetical protein